MIGLGAIPGAWLRLKLVNHFEPMLPNKHWGTFVVNVVACFALGLILRLDELSGGTGGLSLLLGVGFFGSLSTFSTFAVELLTTLKQGHWRESLFLGIGSILGGLAMAGLGYSIGLAERIA